MKRREFDLIVSKLDMKTRSSDHLLAWIEHDGKIVARTRRSHQKGDLPAAFAIRKQLHLNEGELANLIECTLDRDGYLALLREKKVF